MVSEIYSILYHCGICGVGRFDSCFCCKSEIVKENQFHQMDLGDTNGVRCDIIRSDVMALGVVI